jgi:hypothetical protein
MVAAPPDARPSAMSLLRRRVTPAENGARECVEERQKWLSG